MTTHRRKSDLNPKRLSLIIMIVGQTACGWDGAPTADPEQEGDRGANQSARLGFNIQMPFTGFFGHKYVRGTTPGIHATFTGGAYSTDLYARPGTTVHFLVSSKHGPVKGIVEWLDATWAIDPKTGLRCEAGRTVYIGVYISGQRAGGLSFGHLDGVALQHGEEIYNGQALGKLKFHPPNYCYRIKSIHEVHTHFEWEAGQYIPQLGNPDPTLGQLEHVVFQGMPMIDNGGT